MSNWLTDYHAEQKKTSASAKENLEKLADQLIKLGQKEKVRIEFSGSGDSGGIDSVEGWDEEAVPKALREEFKDQVHEFVSNQDVDWWNNDGGCGWFEFNPEWKEGDKDEDDEPVEGRFTYEISYHTSSTEVGASGHF